MSTTTIDRALANDLLAFADDDLAAGHILTSVAGFGPDLEINIALSSMGQDELGHARAYLTALVGSDRDRINEMVFDREPAEYRAARFSWTSGDAWERLVVKQYLFETADLHRRAVAESAVDEDLAATIRRMRGEEEYHLDFWTTWITRTAQLNDDAHQRLAAALQQLWHPAHALFDATFLDLAAHRVAWTSEASTFLATLGLHVPHAPTVKLDDTERDRCLDELRYVRKAMPGRW